MAFIGKQPTASPLTASDITDGIITNAKLAQDIISGETALGAEPADTDEFLVSDAGTLKRMDYSYIKGGGRYTLISSATISGGSTYIDFDDVFTDTYKNYLLVATGIDVNTDGADLHIQVKNSSGLINGASDYEYSYIQRHTNSSSTGVAYDVGQDYIRINNNGVGNSAVENANVTIEIPNARSTSHYKIINTKMTSFTTATNGVINFAVGTVETTTALTGIRLKTHSGNLDAGSLKLYGAND